MQKVRGRFLAVVLAVLMAIGSLPVMAAPPNSDMAPSENGAVDFYEAEYVNDDVYLAHQVDAADLHTADFYAPGGISDPAGPPEPSLIDPLGAPSTTPPPLTIPARRLTPAEFDAWVANYHDRGGINELELEVLRLTNIERVAHGVPPLTLSPIMSMAARFKSQEMVDLQYFGHDSPIYGRFYNIPGQVFGVQANGENLGRYQRSPEVIVNAWMNSPGHRSNLLHPSFTYIGIGHCDYHWTQLFGWDSSAHNPVPAPPLPDGVIVDNWEALRAAVNAAPVGEPHTIYIGSSFPTIVTEITIPAGRDITLVSTLTGPSVLNVRTLTAATRNRRHFIVSANSSLTLGQNIVISGGPLDNSGGIHVNDGGELIMNYGSTINNFVGDRLATTSAVTVRGTFTMNYGSTIDIFSNDNFTRTSAVTVIGMFTMNDGLITGSTSATHIGLVTIDGANANFTMNGGAIRRNSAHIIDRSTFGVFIQSGTMTKNGGDITGFHAGVRLNNMASAFTMRAGKISDNSSGVSISRGTFTMESGEISGNITGVGVTGGTFYMVGDDAIIRDNHSSDRGGGIILTNGQVNITAGTITENTAERGGGVAVISHATHRYSFTMTGGYITNNTATLDGGGIFTSNISHLNPVPETAFPNLNIGPNAVFYGNTAGNGLSAPPDNRLPHIATTNASRWGNPLNNYDINYTGRLGQEHGISSWEALRAAVNAAPANIPTTIYILTSFYAPAPAVGNAIVIPANRQITLVSSNTAAGDANVRILDQQNNNQRHFVVQGSLTLGRNITLRTGANAGGVQVAGGTFLMADGSAIIGG